MKVRVGVQMLVKTYLPRSLTCQVTPAPVNFSCHVIALSLERITSLVMCLILTRTSDLCPRWMDGWSGEQGVHASPEPALLGSGWGPCNACTLLRPWVDAKSQGPQEAG